MLTVAKILGAHGLKGELKLALFVSDAPALPGLGAHVSGRPEARLASLRVTAPGTGVCRISDVTDRTAAEALKGLTLVVAADAFPPADDDEFYPHQLVGLRVVTVTGAPFGTVRAVQNFGAGDLLEIAYAERTGTDYFSFDLKTFPSVHLAKGEIVIVPPGEEE